MPVSLSKRENEMQAEKKTTWTPKQALTEVTTDHSCVYILQEHLLWGMTPFLAQTEKYPWIKSKGTFVDCVEKVAHVRDS